MKEKALESRVARYTLFKSEELASQRKAHEALLIEASEADQLRMKTHERLKNENLTHYAALGIQRDTSTSDIKIAVRKLSVLFHPEKCSDEDATENFQELGGAYEVLSCNEKLAECDARSPERSRAWWRNILLPSVSPRGSNLKFSTKSIIAQLLMMSGVP
jgi:preprotein translocase subunit Sec63